jgi:hypothetical protein
MFSDVFSCDSIIEHEPSTKRIFHSIQGIQQLEIILCYPMIFSMLSAYMRNEKTDSTRKALVRIFESIEKFHFVNTYICDTRANRIEILYTEYCERFNNCNNDFVGLVTTLINKMKNEFTVSEEIFVSNFKDLEYSSTNLRRNAILYYIFDRFNRYDEENDRLTDPAAWSEYFSPGRNVRRHLYSIEHYAPQNPRAGNVIENVHNVGNLFIIGSELNGRLNNLSPEAKIAKLKGEFYQDIGNNKMLKEFVNTCDGNWNRDKVIARSENLAERAFRKIWKL